MIDLSVIIVSYNTEDVTRQCLLSLRKTLHQSNHIKYEVIVVDNNSSDGSSEMLYDQKKVWPKDTFTVIRQNKNLGFGAANNVGIGSARGSYILFLNSDTIIQKLPFDKLISYMNKHDDVGVLTVRVNLEDGNIDWASHRGFPTVWRSFCYFSKIEALTKKIPFLKWYCGGYHLTHCNLSTLHEIDSPTAAFYLTRTYILHKIGGFDTVFFMYGEDLDLSYRIKALGYKIIYDPEYSIIHKKYQSGLKNQDKKTKQFIRGHYFTSMKIFYDKHYAPKHNKFSNYFIHTIINIKSRISNL